MWRVWNRYYVKLFNHHFRRGDKISRSYLAYITGNHLLFIMWWIQGLGRVSQVLYTHSINIMLQPSFLLAGGAREWHCFLSMSSTSTTVSFYTLCPVRSRMLLDNQLVFSSSQSYVRTANICSKHLSNVDRTGVWRHFSRSAGVGVVFTVQCSQRPLSARAKQHFTFHMTSC